MHTAIAELEQAQLRADVPDFRPGDTLKVHVKVTEGNRSRIQVFQGVVIRRQGGGLRETFTVRKVSYGVGVERTFPVHSPSIDKIEAVTRGRSAGPSCTTCATCAARPPGSRSAGRTPPAERLTGLSPMAADPDAQSGRRRRRAGRRPGAGRAEAPETDDRRARNSASKRKRSFWRDLVVIVVAALGADDPAQGVRRAGVLHPLRVDGEHPAARRPDPGQQDRLRLPVDRARRRRRVQRRRLLGPGRAGAVQPGAAALGRRGGPGRDRRRRAPTTSSA